MGDKMSDINSVSKTRLIFEIIGVLVVFVVTMLISVIIVSVGISMFAPDMLIGINPETGAGGEFLSLAGYPLATVMMLVIIHYVLKSRGSGWRDIGLSKPDNFMKTLGWGVAITFGAFVVAFATSEIMTRLGHEQDLAMFDFIEGNLWAYLFMVTIISWFAAALGEEVIFRGVVMGNLAAIFGGERGAWILAAFIQALIFGAFHMYQDIAGGVATGAIALVFGFAYYYLKSLWPVIVAHGLIDTYGMTMFYFTGTAG